MTGVLNCISSNSLWEPGLLVSCLSLKRKRSDSPRCVCGAAEKARPASAPSTPSIFSALIFSGEPARTAPDTNAPSDRLDECELIGLMIFLPHFPPLYGCSMVHGADGWNQLPHTHTHTHTSYLTSMVPTSPAHNTLGGRRTQTFVYSLASPDALAHESPFGRSSRARCESQRVPRCPGRLRMSRASLLFWLALSFQTARTGTSH